MMNRQLNRQQNRQLNRHHTKRLILKKTKMMRKHPLAGNRIGRAGENDERGAKGFDIEAYAVTTRTDKEGGLQKLLDWPMIISITTTGIVTQCMIRASAGRAHLQHVNMQWGILLQYRMRGEEEFIKSIVGNKAFYWLGGYKDDNDNWRWVTDESWEYTDWSPGQPDNYSAIDEAPQGFLVYSTAV